jgi:hypothetical protein
MRIDATGFVGDQAGSVASANAVILRELLSRNHKIRFFTKKPLIYPSLIVSICEPMDCDGDGHRFHFLIVSLPGPMSGPTIADWCAKCGCAIEKS